MDFIIDYLKQENWGWIIISLLLKNVFYLLCADDKKGKMASLLPSHKIKTTPLSLWASQPFFKNTTRSPFYAWGCSQRVSRKRRPKTKDLEKEDYRKQRPRKRSTQDLRPGKLHVRPGKLRLAKIIPGTLQYSPTTLTPTSAVRGPQFTGPNKHL